MDGKYFAKGSATPTFGLNKCHSYETGQDRNYLKK